MALQSPGGIVYDAPGAFHSTSGEQTTVAANALDVPSAAVAADSIHVRTFFPSML